MGILLWVDLYNRPPFYSGDLKSQLSGFPLATVGAGLGTKFSYSPINEQQNPPFLTDN
ncbi:hypothetical protein [Coleofasciculus sp. G2-EDA-02]|uniref:hypothetical protein n=1 Tax=Coleofasciculus sp. G2-EDA-02 TaxID=3069529 RepID=UPI0040637B12